MSRVLYILTGCTAAGKTAIALEWAERCGMEIISCDSMLFYRGMDIGTAKPSIQERRRVAHHLIDLAPVHRTFSVGRYIPMARDAVEDVLSRGKRPLIVGGSGFYLKSFFEPVVDDVMVDASIREQVQRIERAGGLGGLGRELQRLNPDGTGTVDMRNPRRVARALERCLASGKSLAELEAGFRRLPRPFPGFEKKVWILDRDPAELDCRIDRRARKMVGDGLIDEVRRLKEEGIKGNPTAARAIGYRETLEWLEQRERPTQAELADAIAANTRKLVKKQRTWFRGQLPGGSWVTPEEAADAISSCGR